MLLMANSYMVTEAVDNILLISSENHPGGTFCLWKGGEKGGTQQLNDAFTFLDWLEAIQVPQVM